MIKKLRLKFVAVCMALVGIVLTAVFLSAFAAIRENTAFFSHQVLTQVVREDSPDFFRPGLDENSILLPYFTVNVWPGPDGNYTAQVTGGTYAEIEDTEALKEIVSVCLHMEEREGVIPQYHLRFLRVDNGLYQKLAFVDMSMERAVLREMVWAYVLIATAAFLLLLGVSVLLSHWATRPVERAWDQQHQFLSDASHELKTPLTVILSNAELLERTDLPDRPARWADNIHSEARRMKRLVEQMLTLARSDNAASAPVFSDVNLSEVAADCVLSFEPVAFESGHTLDYTLAEDVTVTGDAEKLRQVLAILLDNAVKYGAPGGEITVSLTKTDRKAELAVENPGDPIPPERLKRLFERFYRADDSRGEQSGFGLGLPIAAAIVKEHRGTLKAESTAERTRFLITLPLKPLKKL